MLEQIALSIAAKKLIAIAAGGALAASAAAYSQVDISGGIGGYADFGLDQSPHPVTAEIDFHALLPSVDAEAAIEAATTTVIQDAPRLEAQTEASIGSAVRLDATAPLDVSVALPSTEVAVGGEAGANTTAGVAAAEAQTFADVDAAADTSADVEIGVAAVTADLVTEVDGDLGLGVLVQ